MSAILDDPIFKNDDAARKHLEALRWPEGPYCPWCGQFDSVKPLGGSSMGKGWYHCSYCRDKFTVRVGSVFERSKIPLHKWVAAFHLMAASKKGMSAHQLHRMLGVTYKTAWFMAHRIREAMRDDKASPLGGSGKIVEADETYYGKQEKPHVAPKRKGRPYLKGGTGPAGKRAVVALVERGGSVRTFHVAVADLPTVTKIVNENIDKESRLHTDESSLYRHLGKRFAAHGTIKHSFGEYVRDDIHTNTVEGYFSIFKRGMRGVYQHCAEKHLHRYLAEFDFRYNHRVALGVNDQSRADRAIRGAAGKRLRYQGTH
jgi:transposase-like protein